MRTQVSAETLSVITHDSIPVITTELLAQLYGTEVNNIKVNLTRNRGRFEEGKHYFKLEGEALRTMKHRVTQSNSVKIARNVRSLILWTERGAARHAKMLETDQAWDVFEKLEDCYFNTKSEQVTPTPAVPQFNDEQLLMLAWLWRASEYMLNAINDVYPSVAQAGHQREPVLYSIQREYPRVIRQAQTLLAAATAHVQYDPRVDNNWSRVLPVLRHVAIPRM